jgi:hypothetical protein
MSPPVAKRAAISTENTTVRELASRDTALFSDEPDAMTDRELISGSQKITTKMALAGDGWLRFVLMIFSNQIFSLSSNTYLR